MKYFILPLLLICSYVHAQDAPPVVPYPKDNSKRQLLITDMKRNKTWALSSGNLKFIQAYYATSEGENKYVSGWLRAVTDTSISLGKKKPDYLLRNLKYIERVNYGFRGLGPLYVCSILAYTASATWNPRGYVLPIIGFSIAGAAIAYEWTFHWHRGKVKRRPVGRRMQVATYDPYRSRVKVFQ